MKTICGGTVRYVAVELLPCPEDATLVGQCEGPATLEIRQCDRVVETFALVAGDQLQVADGADVAPGTSLVFDPPWQTVRAHIPPDVEAIARWSEDLDEIADDVTGLASAAFRPELGPVRLELRTPDDDACLVSYELARWNHTPLVRSGTVVRRGDRLAAVDPPSYAKACVSLPSLRAFLSARPLAHLPRALVSPCDGTLEAIDERTVTLRSIDGRHLRLRRPRRQHLAVRVGDPVRAGDPVTHGERSHHALLHAWDEDQLADHMLHELQCFLGTSVPRAYWSLVLRAMLGWRRIREPGDTGLARGAVISREQLDGLQHTTRARGGAPATASAALRGIDAIAHDRRRRQP